jgi:hypothetical protein
MQSPAKYLLRFVHEAIVNVAPQRKAAFDDQHSDFTLEYLDQPDFVCDVDTARRYLRLSRGVVEFLWALSYAHVLLYSKWVEGKTFTKQ